MEANRHRESVDLTAEVRTLPEVIETERLVLRPFELTDVDDVLAYAQDPEWSRYLKALPRPYLREDAERFVARQLLLDRAAHPSWAVVVHDTVIGGINLRFTFEHGLAELGYSIARTHWNNGLCSEAARAVIHSAFSSLDDLNRIQARADVRNGASQRVMEKVGMVKEGVLRQSRIERGEALDEAWYSILRSQWDSQSGAVGPRMRNSKPSDDLAFRGVRTDDLPRLQEIREAAFAPVFASFRSILGDAIYAVAQAHDDAAQADHLTSLVGPSSSWEVYACERSGEIVGFVSIRLEEDRGLGEIGLNAVHPDFAGRGIGTSLYDFALDRMSAAGLRVATVSTGGDTSHGPARRAYAKAGFSAAIPSLWMCCDLAEREARRAGG